MPLAFTDPSRLNLFGSPFLNYEDFGDITFDRYGLGHATVVYSFPRAAFIANPTTTITELMSTDGIALGSSHPFVSYLWVVNAVISFAKKDGYAHITVTYEGFPDGITPVTIYELVSSCGEEPIETNINFKTSVAGTPSSPLNSAIFVDFQTGAPTSDNTRGIFKEFPPFTDSMGTQNNKAGITKFLAPTQTTFRATTVTAYESVDMGSLGKIDTPSNAPDVSDMDGSPNWLYIGINATQRGNAMVIVQEWKLSGHLGWDSQIYNAG